MKPISRPNLLDYSLILLTAVMWASAFSAIKVSVLGIGPLWTAAGRVGTGFVALGLLATLLNTTWPGRQAPWAKFVLISLLNIAIPFLLVSWALKFVDSGVAALLMGVGPILAMVIGHLFTQDDRINRFKLLAVFLGCSGILTMIGFEALRGLGSQMVVAQLAIVSASACYVTSGHLMRQLDIRPVPFTTIALGVSAVVLGLIAFCAEGIPVQLPDFSVIAALVWLGLFPTALAYILRFYLVRKVGLSTFAVGMNLVPVLGIIIGAVLLSEVIEASTIIALVLIMSGLMAARYATGGGTLSDQGKGQELREPGR